MPADNWNPDQYNKFREQRMQPFYDLTALIPYSRTSRHMSAIDLGCGTGELTAMLADLLPLDCIEGIDSSAAMLDKANPRASDRVKFRLLSMTDVPDFSSYDLIFSNAAFHWIQDNEKFLSRILKQMKNGAQIAVQLPKNDNHPSHSLAAEIAQEKPFCDLFKGFVHRSGALGLERYAELLYDYGLREQVCIEKIYGHELEHSSEVVEWVKGTTLTPYLSRLDEAGKEFFLSAYRERLLEKIGNRSPYFYPFRRLLFWGRKD